MAHKPYTREPSGSDTAVLMIHGIVGSPDHFLPLLPLVPQNWSVYTLLLDGHGSSVKDFAHTSMEKWERQTAERIDNLCRRYQNVILVGHSMGTLLAIDGALAHPDKVKALILLAAPLKIRMLPSAARNSLRVVWGRVPENDPVAVAAQGAFSITPDKNLTHYIPWLPRYRELFQKAGQTRKKLGGLQSPCFAFQSDKDELVAPGAARLLQKEPRITLYRLPHSRHFYYTEEDLCFLQEKFSEICAKIHSAAT